MAKKKFKFTVGKLLAAISALLGVVAIILLCAPAMSPNGDLQSLGADGSVSMANAVFGNADGGYAFSFMLFLPYLLVIAGIALNVLTVLGKGGKILPIIAAVCYVVAGVLFFLVMQTYCVAVPEGLEGTLKDRFIESAKEVIARTLVLGWGAILSGILAFVSAAASAASPFIKK